MTRHQLVACHGLAVFELDFYFSMSVTFQLFIKVQSGQRTKFFLNVFQSIIVRVFQFPIMRTENLLGICNWL